MRKLVLGDIHGGFRGLEQVLQRCKYDTSKDQLITLGDYVDGWSESYEVIDLLLTVANESDNSPIFIMGNHDDSFLSWLEWGIHPKAWSGGGHTTAQSYINNAKNVPHLTLQPRQGGWSTNLCTIDVSKSHKEFFKSLRYYHHDIKENNAFVHGGFYHGLGYDELETYMYDRDLWEMDACPGHPFYKKEKDRNTMPRRLREYNEIFIGHTPTTNWRTDQPMNKCNVWNLDTGAGWNGRLTIMDVDTKEYWQSDKLTDLYPDEKGRT